MINVESSSTKKKIFDWDFDQEIKPDLTEKLVLEYLDGEVSLAVFRKFWTIVILTTG